MASPLADVVRHDFDLFFKVKHLLYNCNKKCAVTLHIPSTFVSTGTAPALELLYLRVSSCNYYFF